jgi:hypothetical protein
MIFMPLTPRLLVVIGPTNATRSITDHGVDLHTKMQVLEARGYVLHRPGADFAASIATWRT